jgi:hypothetical protein
MICSAHVSAQESSAGVIASNTGGAVGYQHNLERSHFSVGDRDAASRRIEENGFAKVIGPNGVFATNLRNGLAVAIQSDGADKPSVKAADLNFKPTYRGDAEQHNKQVLDYFLHAGVPKDQLGGVHANTYLSARGSARDIRTAQTNVDGYATILERKIGNYPVIDSVAWARMDEEGRVISEWVYWPAIPAKAIRDAKQLEEKTVDQSKGGFLSRLPSGLPRGKVVIRHSSATEEGPFEVFASYDVLEKRGSAVSFQSKNETVTTRTEAVITRHFDVDGVERRLPQEKHNFGRDCPPKSKDPERPPSGNEECKY